MYGLFKIWFKCKNGVQCGALTMTIKYKKMNYNGSFDSILKTDDANSSIYLSIPLEPTNTDYQEYLAWVADGITAEAAA